MLGHSVSPHVHLKCLFGAGITRMGFSKVNPNFSIHDLLIFESEGILQSTIRLTLLLTRLPRHLFRQLVPLPSVFNILGCFLSYWVRNISAQIMSFSLDIYLSLAVFQRYPEYAKRSMWVSWVICVCALILSSFGKHVGSYVHAFVSHY